MKTKHKFYAIIAFIVIIMLSLTVCDQDNKDNGGCTHLGHDFGSGSVISEFVEKSFCKRVDCDEEKYNFLLSLGDTGPGGGKIMYVADGQNERTLGFTMTDDDSTAYYLEAGLNDLGVTFWVSAGFYSTNITGTETAIGTGRKNTALILAVNSSAPPASACKNYKGAVREVHFG